MNMQNNTKHIFSSPPNHLLCSQSLGSDLGTQNSQILQILENSPKKTKLTEKFNLPDKKRIPAPLANPHS